MVWFQIGSDSFKNYSCKKFTGFKINLCLCGESCSYLYVISMIEYCLYFLLVILHLGAASVSACSDGDTVVESGLSTCLADTELALGRAGGDSERSSVALLALSLS